MKAQKRISYSEDVDILMIQLSDQKIDDAYDTDNMIVQVDKNGKPVLLEIFHGKEYLKEMTKVIPKKMKKEILSRTMPISVAHEIKVQNK